MKTYLQAAWRGTLMVLCLLWACLAGWSWDSSLRIIKMATPPTINGQAEDWAGNTTGHSITGKSGPCATVRLGYDATSLYLLYEVQSPTQGANNTTVFQELMKGGDAIGLCLGPINGAGVNQRLVIAQVNGKATVVLIRPQSVVKKPYTYRSPAGASPMDEVAAITDARAVIRPVTGGYIAEVAVPWTALGVSPTENASFPCDAQVIFANPAGTTNIASYWWCSTGSGPTCVMDLPTEAKLYPEQWAKATFTSINIGTRVGRPVEWTLRTNRLAVTIAEPGSVYRGPRFDWTGFITQVVLDGQHSFCVSENEDPAEEGGSGICNEFGIETAVGYNEAKPGAQFVKPGVGLLTRIDALRYKFYQPYQVDPFHIQTVVANDKIDFVIDPMPCNGIAFQLRKTIQVADDRLTINYTMENTGDRLLEVDEYCHNILSINGAGTGPDMRLTLPFTTPARVPASWKRLGSNQLTWLTQPKNADYLGSGSFDVVDTARWWQITHVPTGVSVQEHTSFAWSRFALFCTSRILSPEVFIAISLPPGQSQSWTREYCFFISTPEEIEHPKLR